MFQLSIKPVFYLFVFTLVLSACKKGDTGPAGPAGPQGPANNANVVSGTFTLTNADYVNGYWAMSTGPGSSMGYGAKVATKNLPDLTAGIAGNGTVLVYLKVPDGVGGNVNLWTLLPFDIPNINVGYFIAIRNTVDVGKVKVYYLYMPTDKSVVVPNIFTATLPDYTFRYVLIAGNANARQAAPPVDYADYEAVKKYYRLKD
ncbi:hypothetical protein [Chitinophaga flava]|uniref:Collagen-like protein n=1 Tax=Chitinophaga flava TaxID=2259036 RepID=A0A365XS72_9BACT|nr:hypothetical protein [Chitinophaga flava]RBL89207.1 hypothetical protein DF182_22035 [Chitinophaga flava]